jgi:hypothetical protein
VMGWGRGCFVGGYHCEGGKRVQEKRVHGW